MDKTLRRIIERLEKHERTHKRVDIGRKRRLFIRDSYERLKAIESKASIGVRYSKSSVEIRIVSNELLSCSQAPALSNLIGLSDICSIRKCRRNIIVDIELFLWRWAKKESPSTL
ncbi:hypothetical protein D3Z51_03980 [Clostridiaceae bacterium]|nr:hypothetical protein [Clostridiaceae bacterium]RKI13360.1 hypothetical protein D7V81_10455 [bacterium 1XD21-70]